MKIIFLRRKTLIAAFWVITALLVLFFAIYFWWGYRTEPALKFEPIYQGKNDKPFVALTVNVDWGEDIVPKMLDVLQKKEVKATFFVTGRFATKFPEVVQEIAALGCEIGNHGYSHPHPDGISVQKNKEEILKTHKVLTELVNSKITLFAPPYGERGTNCLQAAQECGYKTILWTADSIDWQEPPPSINTIVKRVTGKKLTNGTIILLHPKPHTLQALPVIIDVIKSKGYELKTVSEII